MNVHELITAHGREVARTMVPIRERHLVDMAAEMMSCELTEADIGYLYSGWALTALPHRRPKDDKEFLPWSRENGRFSLMVEPGSMYGPKREIVRVGIPYGSRARLILFYLQTEAIKRQSREVELGACLGRWLSKMGIPDGGANYASVRDQSQRLSACRLTIGWSGEDGRAGFQRANIVSQMMFIPLVTDARQGDLWSETVQLSPEFYDSLVSHPVPVAEHAIRALQNSSLSMDVYVWLSYRLRSLSKATTVSWAALHSQFGPEYATTKSFRERFIPNLKEALAVYPDAKVDVSVAGVVLYPSPPAVPDRASMPVRRISAR